MVAKAVHPGRDQSKIKYPCAISTFAAYSPLVIHGDWPSKVDGMGSGQKKPMLYFYTHQKGSGVDPSLSRLLRPQGRIGSRTIDNCCNLLLLSAFAICIFPLNFYYCTSYFDTRSNLLLFVLQKGPREKVHLSSNATKTR